MISAGRNRTCLNFCKSMIDVHMPLFSIGILNSKEKRTFYQQSTGSVRSICQDHPYKNTFQ